MRSVLFLFLVIPLLGTGWVSLKAEPARPLGGLQPIAVSHAPDELPEVVETHASFRAAVVELPTLMDEVPEASPDSNQVALVPLDLPLLPINPLLEEDATPERYAEWYRGTATEHLCQSLFRLNSIRNWVPETCSCVNSELLLRRSATHERVHELHLKPDLLLKEGGWLAIEIRRKVQADLASGGSLMVFRMPQTKEGMKRSLKGSSKEERWILSHLLVEAQVETRRVAIEAEYAAGRYRVEASSPFG